MLINSQAKYPQRVELKTLQKILEYCNFNGRQRRTNLATCCKMCYSRFIPYLNISLYFGLLQIIEDNGKFVIITETGKIVLEKLQNIDFCDQ